MEETIIMKRYKEHSIIVCDRDQTTVSTVEFSGTEISPKEELILALCEYLEVTTDDLESFISRLSGINN